jgi:hypothetical protein
MEFGTRKYSLSYIVSDIAYIGVGGNLPADAFYPIARFDADGKLLNGANFYVLEGSGIVTLNDAPHTFEKGGTIFIPRNSWHGFSKPDHEPLLLWIISPAGLDD